MSGDEDDEDFSDDAMMKLDSVLGEMFRRRKVSGVSS